MSFAPHPFTLRQLQYVVAVAEELSFRRAAERCHVSQPSLSMQLTQVEKALGIQLFERARKRVVVTAAGRDLVERARGLLRDADAIVRVAERAADPLSGNVRLGVIPTISPYLVPTFTTSLRVALPRLRVLWAEEVTDALMDKLADGRIEAAVVALEAELGDVESESLGKDPFVLVTRPDHPLAKKSRPAATSELSDEEVLLLDEGHCFRDQALDLCDRARARVGEFRATSLCTLVQMVSSGGGVTLIPTIAIDLEATRAGLHVRPLTGVGASRTLALVWRKGTSSDALLREMARIMREAFARIQGLPPTAKRGRAGRAPSNPDRDKARSRR